MTGPLNMTVSDGLPQTAMTRLAGPRQRGTYAYSFGGIGGGGIGSGGGGGCR